MKPFWKRKEKPSENKTNLPDNIKAEEAYIFIHIPKNAGTSITTMLGIADTSHHTALQYRNILGENTFQRLRKICFSRNPWSRFLSLYHYARSEESIYHSSIDPQKARYGKHLDYDLLKDASLKDCAHYLLEGKLKHDKFWNHWLPQTKWILDEKGQSLVDFIGSIENLEDSIKNLSSLISIEKPLSHINPSSSNLLQYRDFYDDETRKIVEDFYQEDIKFFGYKF